MVSPIVAVAKATLDISKATEDTPRTASLKDIRDVVEYGGCTIWRQLPDIPYKSEKFGPGFTSKAQKVV